MTKSSVKSHREWEQQRKRGKTNKRVVESGDGDTFYIKVYWDFKWDENRISFSILPWIDTGWGEKVKEYSSVSCRDRSNSTVTFPFHLGIWIFFIYQQINTLKSTGQKIYLKKLSSSVIHSQTINRQCQLGLHLIPQSVWIHAFASAETNTSAMHED